MKILTLLFFILTFPLVIFITTLLYGGFSTTVLKVELAKSGMYEKIISVAKVSSEEEGTDPLFAIIQNRINPDYLQTKVEKTIDDTALWVTGKTQTPPTLSFKDIKDELTTTNPTLLTEVQNISQEMQQAAAAENGEMTVANQPNDLETFIKNDFSFPLKDSFAGVKQGYIVLTIALPMLIILLILSLVGLWIWNPTLQKKIRWFGVTFIVTGVLGFVTILLNKSISTTSLSYLLKQEDQMLQMIYPLLEHILMLFVNQYAAYQIIGSSVLLSLGIISLVLSFVIKPKTTVPQPIKSAKPTKPTKKSR